MQSSPTAPFMRCIDWFNSLAGVPCITLMFLYTCSAVLPSLAGDTCAEADPAAAPSSPTTKTPHRERSISHLSCRGMGSAIIGNSPAHHGHHRLDVFDLIGGNREV